MAFCMIMHVCSLTIIYSAEPLSHLHLNAPVGCTAHAIVVACILPGLLSLLNPAGAKEKAVILTRMFQVAP